MASLVWSVVGAVFGVNRHLSHLPDKIVQHILFVYTTMMALDLKKEKQESVFWVQFLVLGVEWKYIQI